MILVKAALLLEKVHDLPLFTGTSWHPWNTSYCHYTDEETEDQGKKDFSFRLHEWHSTNTYWVSGLPWFLLMHLPLLLTLIKRLLPARHSHYSILSATSWNGHSVHLHFYNRKIAKLRFRELKSLDQSHQNLNLGIYDFEHCALNHSTALCPMRSIPWCLPSVFPVLRKLSIYKSSSRLHPDFRDLTSK